MSLRILHSLPDGLLSCTPATLKNVLSDGSLICLKGDRPAPLFLSCLLHGNETSSFYAVIKLLQNVSRLPRSLMIFFGNVTAASQALRQMPNGPDFNRIWAGGMTQEERMASEVLDFARGQELWASIDMHNNTGDNPYYACINKRDHPTLGLASLFSDKMLFFEEPRQTQSIAFSKFCTSVTLECGKSGDQLGVTLLVHYLEKVLTLESLEEINLSGDKVSAFQTVSRILLPPSLEVDFAFNDSSSSQLSFLPELESYNFQVIKKGTFLAKLPGPFSTECHLQVLDNSGGDLTNKYFRRRQNNLVVENDFIPAMLTKDVRVAKDDCLGYILQKLSNGKS
ncbi:MAG: hypothetical protein A2X86_14640 [Bdellovibrionales bacterium GWA2_49_15]|nr:MAG: hypothetical protein A2X86_14640 [Bdellovibrionales bacterium GWA2_49_15]HAZ13422.1 succinylglutamate desuccinylase [Bdellovibrionales bacterium]